MIVEQSFGVQIIRIYHILFELCMREKKEGKKERKKERRKKNKIEIFMFDFLDCEKD